MPNTNTPLVNGKEELSKADKMFQELGYIKEYEHSRAVLYVNNNENVDIEEIFIQRTSGMVELGLKNKKSIISLDYLIQYAINRKQKEFRKVSVGDLWPF